MPRRQSIPYGYPDRPPTRILPPSYQPELIPVRAGPPQMMVHHNSLRRHRVAPPPVEHYSYGHPNQSYESPPSRMSPNYRQDDEMGEYAEPKSCWSKPLCLGLTRLSGGVLFGTMIILSVGSIAGLITSVVLYLQDMNTDPQWKILGMVVCAIMLLTVLATLCIFIYCYQKGHIKKSTNHPGDDFTPSYHHRSPLPYGRMGNGSPMSYDDEIVPVQDKLTNTEATNAPLRPRDIQRGVWQGKNAYNGYAHRPIDPPRMTHRVVQALPHEIDQGPTRPRHPAMNGVPQTIIRLPEQRSRRLRDAEPPYDVVEEVIRRPRKRDSDDYVEIVRMPKKDTSNPRFKKVSVKHVRAVEEPEDVDDDFPTDHFYQ